MHKIESLIPRILPQVLPCPKAMVMDALQAVCVDFCKTSGVWRYSEQVLGLSGEQIFTPNIPKGASIIGIKSLLADQSILDKSLYMVNSFDVTLYHPLPRDTIIGFNLVLRPSRMLEILPADILEEWGDSLVYGTIAKVKSMSGTDIEWSDRNGASINLGLYNEGLARAKVNVIRRSRNYATFMMNG